MYKPATNEPMTKVVTVMNAEHRRLVFHPIMNSSLSERLDDREASPRRRVPSARSNAPSVTQWRPGVNF